MLCVGLTVSGWALLFFGLFGLVFSCTVTGLIIGLYVMADDWTVIPLLASPLAVMALGTALIRVGHSLSLPRQRVGFCRGCGYDLRGSSGARCSECGLLK